MNFIRKFKFAAMAAAVLGASTAMGVKVDLTALVRSESSPTITRVDGTVRKDTEDVNHAFDGDTSKDGRVMFTSSTGVIQYDIPASFRVGESFTLISYRLTRTSSDESYDLPRAPTQFKLEAFDGSDWVVLHEKTASDPETRWSANDIKAITYAIPAANQVASRSYRFSALANNGSTHTVPLSLNDITFYIDVEGDDPDLIKAGQTLSVSSDPGSGHQYTVYGTLSFTGSRSVLNYDDASVTVKNGGIFNISCDSAEGGGDYPGFMLHQNATVTVEAGGTMVEAKERRIGSAAQGLIHLDGGELQMFPTSNNNEDYIRNMKLSNGGTITGGYVGFGWCTEGDGHRYGNMGSIIVYGTNTSYISTTEFGLGGGNGWAASYYAITNGNNKSAHNSMGGTITVNDVTGDAASDLVITALTTTSTKYQDWPPENIYLEKLGAGTLELAGGIQNVPGVKLGAGTLLLGATTGNSINTMTITGNSTFSVADGATISIGTLVVENGATLTLDVDFNESTINVGPIDQAVLDAIVYQGKTEALAIEDGHLVSTLVTEEPVIGAVSVAVQNITNATFAAEIIEFGAEQNAADLWVAIGTDPANLGEFAKVGEGIADATSVTGTISGLVEQVTYYYEAKLKNAAGYFGTKVRSGSFRTLPEMLTVPTPVCYSGLLQGKINVANDFSTDILANSVINPEVVPGVVMALYKVSSGQQDSVFYTSPYTGSEIKWNGSSTTFGYFGEIYLEEGITITFGKNMDDSVLIKIGETEVLKNTTWNAYPTAAYTASETGWYPIEVRAGDGDGGKGVADSGKFNGFGVAYNLNGTTDAASGDWALLEDAAHDGSFLRWTDNSDTGRLQMTTVQVDGNDVVVWLGATGTVGAGTKLVAYYGATDGGSNPAAWNGHTDLATFNDGTAPTAKYTLQNFATYGAVRFAIVAPGSATVQGFYQFSPVTEFAQVDPIGTIALHGDPLATSVAVDVDVAALGMGAASASAYAEISESGDFDDTVRTKIGDVNIAGPLAGNVTGLTAATTYYLRLVVENNLNKTFTSSAITFTTYNPNIAHPGDPLYWAGGATGTWNDSTVCWQLGNGVAVAWLDGCKACFTNDAAIAVSGERTVVCIESGADVTLTGDAVTFTAPSTVVYNDNGTLRFENDVNAANGITFDVREEHDIIYESELVGNLTDTDQLLFRNVKLADVDAFFAHFYGNFGNDKRNEIMRSDVEPQSNLGVFYITKTDTEFIGQFQMICSAAHNIIKVRLHQVGDDVWGQYLYSVSYCTWSEYNPHHFKFGDNFDEPVANNWLGTGYGQTMCELELRKMDYLPTGIRTEFAGAYNAKEVETVVNAGTLAFCGEHALKCRPRAQNGGAVEFASGSQTSIYNADLCKFLGAPFYVYGTINVVDGGTDGNYNLLGGAKNGFYICNGGRFISKSIWDPYGFNGCKITVLEGGILETIGNFGIGCNGNEVVLNGGEWLQSYDYRDNEDRHVILKSVTLSGGAAINGYIGTMGYDYYNQSHNVTVNGDTACSINLDVLRLGNKNKHIDTGASGSGCLSIFDVKDVTGDAASDLVVNSTIVGAAGMTVDAGCESYYYLNKKSAGTLELTGTNSCASLCQFRVEAGTVKLANDAKAEFGTFYLKGNGAIDFGEGSKFAFADSSVIDWASDKTLTLTGALNSRTLRFGTDENGLTAEQLAQIRYVTAAGRVKPVTINNNGYICGPATSTVLMFK